MLRKRQVEIVNSFVSDIRAGRSRVQQMIMGAGIESCVSLSLSLPIPLMPRMLRFTRVKAKRRLWDRC